MMEGLWQSLSKPPKEKKNSSWGPGDFWDLQGLQHRLLACKGQNCANCHWFLYVEMPALAQVAFRMQFYSHNRSTNQVWRQDTCMWLSWPVTIVRFQTDIIMQKSPSSNTNNPMFSCWFTQSSPLHSHWSEMSLVASQPPVIINMFTQRMVQSHMAPFYNQS